MNYNKKSIEDIEVAAAENTLAGYINVFNGLLIVVHSDSSIYLG